VTLPLDHRVILNGNHYEVESIVEKMMRDGNHRSTAAKFKYLLAILPCRAPNKFGLSSTSGLEFGARILTASADIYCNTKGPGSSLLKKRWMAAFVDITTWMIQDDEMLHGMLRHSPSKLSVEAISSTELMGIVLHFKFLEGPILLFAARYFYSPSSFSSFSFYFPL